MHPVFEAERETGCKMLDARRRPLLNALMTNDRNIPSVASTEVRFGGSMHGGLSSLRDRVVVMVTLAE